MSERLELYKEIIELDPHSRVFFKYAQLLEKEQRVDEALSALARGLEHQPDFMEARLYYIDLLTRNDKLESAGIQLQKFTSLFKKYPAFWLTWSKLTVDENSTISSTLALLSALFNNPSLSIMQIFQAGLQLHTDQISTATLPQDSTLKSQESFVPAPSAQTASESPLSISDTISAILAANDSLTSYQPTDLFIDSDEILEEDSIANPKASVQTRSMADLLAEQGDIQGAINIYSELLEKADSSEKLELANRLSSLKEHLERNQMGMSNEVETPRIAEKKESEKKLAPRMQNMLERLADRLEDRALRAN